MSLMIGVMIVLLVVGFMGPGRHSMMGGHGEVTHKEEATVKSKDAACPQCPGESAAETGKGAAERP